MGDISLASIVPSAEPFLSLIELTIAYTLISPSLTEWTQLLESLDETGVITTSLPHPSLQVGVRVFRVGNTNVSCLHQLRQMSFRSRRIWISISDPQSLWPKLSVELESATMAWQRLLASTSLVYSMLPRPTLVCQAAADAMANDTLVGIGGYVVFPSGISGWFQIKLQACDLEGVLTYSRTRRWRKFQKGKNI